MPIAFLGVALSTAVLLAAFRWLLAADRRALLVAYALGLAGLVFLAYLTAVSLFLIGALCVWCLAYALTVVAGWVVALRALHDGG